MPHHCNTDLGSEWGLPGLNRIALLASGIAAWLALAAGSAAQPYPTTAAPSGSRQPGFVSSSNAGTAGPSAQGAQQRRTLTANGPAKVPESGVQSLWHSFLGTNAVPPPRPGIRPQDAKDGAARQQPPSGQIPVPNISIPPGSTGPGSTIGSLFGQITGKTPVAATPTDPAARPNVRRPDAPSVIPSAPAISLAAGERSIGNATDNRQATTAIYQSPTPPVTPPQLARPYPETSARATPPQGMIPSPDSLANISDAVASAGQEGSSLSGLWRSVTMDQSGRSPSQARQPLPPPQSLAAPATDVAPPALGESRLASLMMQPFQETNSGTAGVNGGARSEEGLAAHATPSNLENTLRASALLQQLSMSVRGEPYSPPTSLADAPPASPLFRTEQLTTSRLDPLVLAAIANGTASEAELAAFLQELAPEPADLDVEEGAERQSLKNEENAEAGGKGEEKSLAGAEKLGTKPEDNSLQFLRAETVLLKPGDSQFDIGLQYLFTENEFPILISNSTGDIVGVDEIKFVGRELAVPMEYRVGLLPKVQGFLGTSVGWANTQLALDSFDVFDNDGGLGDVYFGLTTQLAAAEANKPYVIATVSAIAPTGGDPFIGAIGFAPSAPSLGQGFWSIAGNLLCIQPYDPVIIFYGVGAKVLFAREYLGAEFEPGNQYNYQMGIGFAVNERITLSTRFFGSYIEEFRVNRERRFGTNAEPMTLRLSATISKPCERYLEPFVEFGLNDDAVSSFFGIQYTY